MNSGQRFPTLLVVSCLLCSLLTAHRPLPAQPKFFEPTADYYKAQGRGIRAEWEVSRKTVVEGRDLTATLVITGATNPTEIEKPDLNKLKAFANFSVNNLPDPPRKPGDKVVRFNYKLTPRNRSADQVPALKFHYFNKAAAEGRQFPATYADSVPITVTERPPPDAIEMVEADHLFHVANGPEVLGGPFEPCWWAWGAAALFGPLVAVGWFLAWRRVFPNAHQLAQLRRSRAARRAADAIRKSGRTPDPPATIAAAVLAYLRTRYPLPESAVTPPEIAAALLELKVPAEVAGFVADVFRACDRARFAPSNDGGVSLAADAESAITRLEELA